MLIGSYQFHLQTPRVVSLHRGSIGKVCKQSVLRSSRSAVATNCAYVRVSVKKLGEFDRRHRMWTPCIYVLLHHSPDLKHFQAPRILLSVRYYLSNASSTLPIRFSSIFYLPTNQYGRRRKEARQYLQTQEPR